MQGITGGELLFRRHRHDEQFPLISPAAKNEYITTFLDIDEDRAMLKRYYSDKLVSLRKLRNRQNHIYTQQERSEARMAPEILKLKYQQVLSKVGLLNEQLTGKTDDVVCDLDVKLMQQILRYFSIVKEESKLTSKRKEDEHRKFQGEINQIKSNRHLKLFATHIIEESRGAISLSYLLNDSAQFKRCEKAVIDNASAGLKEHTKVVNILKLEHTFLSADLHVCSKLYPQNYFTFLEA